MVDSKMNKTIFITSFFGLIARNILSTSVLKILSQQAGLRIVILAPEEKKDFYQKSFGAGNVIVEGVKLDPVESLSKLEKLFYSLFLNFSDTSAFRINRLIERGKYHRYVKSFLHWLSAKLGNLRFIRKFLRRLDYALMPKNKFRKYFDQYNPSLVFSTDIFQINDVEVMRAARARDVYVVGMVRSWDNITSHGLNRIIPDKLIVHTPKIKEEAIQYNDINPNDIRVVGIPHYDRYISEPRISREVLFKELNLDPAKKTIFFAPPADLFSGNDPVSVKIIKELSNLDAQLIIRLYIVGRVQLGEIRPIPNKIAIDDPSNSGFFADVDLAMKDSRLADLLYHSDVVVAFASSLAIDAALFNKPVVFIGFDGEPRPYWKSLRRFYDFDHQKRLLEIGGVKLAKDKEGLLGYVQDYLDNPELDKNKRKELTEEYSWKLDGKSAERLAGFLVEQLGGV